MAKFSDFILFFLILVNVNAENINKTLQQIHVLFRHGERTPTETYPLDPYLNYSWPGGWGQLTNKGKYQMYKLGQRLRKNYKSFLNDYYLNEEVEVLSSYSDRCLMSAELLLAGLFPPINEQIWNEKLLWQPIPVKYQPRNKDKLIAMKAPCPKYDKELNYMFKSGKAQKINEENKELYGYLSKNTGQNITSILDVEFLYNTLEIELINNLTLPDWIKKISLKQIKSIASESLATFTANSYMKKMKGGVFLNKIIKSMEKKMPILYLYSGHDITIVNVLRTLGVVELLKPGYAASFIIELYSNGEIKMVYMDGVDEPASEFHLKDCQSPCLLKDFKVIINELLPKDWERECNE